MWSWLQQPRAMVLLFLLAAVLLSAVAVTHSQFESRKLFSELENLRVQRDAIVVDWGRLQIELATWAEQGRVAEKATAELDMTVPDINRIVVIKH
ncbi:MAG: cell division protein FtsL [Chromatiales bacterium]|jgi:cell division protein FtsL